MTEIMSAPDKGIPQDLLGKAECLVVVPGVKKAAFIVGAKYGKGFMLCRKAGGGLVGAGRYSHGRRQRWISDRRFRDRCRVAGDEPGRGQEINAEQIYHRARMQTPHSGRWAAILPLRRMLKCTPRSLLTRARAGFSRAYRCKARRCGRMRTGTQSCTASRFRIARSCWANTPIPQSATRLIMVLNKYSSRKGIRSQKAVSGFVV